MVRLFAFCMSTAAVGAYGERATSITVERIELWAEENGGTPLNMTIITGEVDKKSMSSMVDAQVSYAFDMVIEKASADLHTILTAASASISLKYQSITASPPCPAGIGCYGYQVQTKVITDTGKSFTYGGSYEFPTHKLDAVVETVPAPSGFDMTNQTVTLLQPPEHQGNYRCRDTVRKVCEEMENMNGCRTVDDYHCSGGPMQFKWGNDAYFGGFVLPEGMCVTTYRHWGYCPSGQLQHDKQCAVGGARRLIYWNPGDRTCSWKFELAPGFYCPGMMGDTSNFLV